MFLILPLTLLAAPPPAAERLMVQAETAPPPEEPAPPAEASEQPPAPEAQPPAPEAKPPAEEPEEEREVTRVPLVGIERGGVLLRPGQFNFETSFAYSHTTSTRLILTGFSIIPLIILGTLESEKVKQDSLSATWAFRYGVMKDLQADARVSIAYRTQTRIRLSNEQVGLVQEEADQFGLGDIDFGVTYQPLYEKGWLPDLTIGLRARAPTGRSQFDIFETIAAQGRFASIEDFVTRLNAEGLPSGSGFWGLTVSLSGVKAFDPAVLFGGVSYTYNIPQDVTLIAIGQQLVEDLIFLSPQAVTVHLAPGGSLGFNLGFALSLTREMSVSFSFADAITFNTQQNGQTIPDSSLNVASFSAGFNLALSERVTVSFSGTMGLTADAPDVTFGLSVPVAFNSLKELWPF